MNDRPNIQLHIDRLVFDGISLSHAQRRLLQAAVEEELGRLLTANGFTYSLIGLTVPYLAANSIQLASNNDPVQMGHQIAQTVYRGLNNGT